MRKPTPAHLRAVQLMAGFFSAEAERGRLRKVSSESLARIYLGTLMQHVIQQYWWSGPEVPPLVSADYVRALIDVLLHGLVPRGPPRRTANDRRGFRRDAFAPTFIESSLHNPRSAHLGRPPRRRPALALQPLSAFVAGARRASTDDRIAALSAVQQDAEALAALGRVLPSATARGVYTRNEFEAKLPVATRKS